MNSWNFTGRVGRDAEQRFTPDGTSIVGFTVAVTSGYGQNEATTWTRCQMFGKRGESVQQYLVKGQLVGVSGEMTAREWTNKDGLKQTSIEVRVNDLTLLGKREDSQQAPSQPAPQAQRRPDPVTTIDDDSGIPF